MKKYITFSLLSWALFCMIGLSVFGQETKVPKEQEVTESLLDKVIDATGGREALEAIKDTTFSGTMDLVQMGLSGTFTIYHKEPYKFRQDMEVMGMTIVSAFNGELGWSIDPLTGAIEDLPESAQVDAKNEALGFGFSYMLYPEKYGITFTEKGTETVGDIEYLLLEMTFDTGDTSLFYIHPITFLPYKIKSITLNELGIEVEQETILENYNVVEEINFAHLIVIYQDGEEFGSIFVEEVQFNTDLEDSLFEKQQK